MGTNKSRVVYFGWIPILSYNIRPENRNISEDKFTRVFSDLDLKQKINIQVTDFDKKGFLSKFVVAIPKRNSALESLTIEVNCKIRESGLVSFNFTTVPFNLGIEDEELREIFQSNLKVNLFDVIRDIYHKHIHHKKDSDAILSPVKAKDEKEAAEKILEQYSDKIFHYHRLIEKIGMVNFVTRFCDTKKRLDLLTSALGEFIYAQSFILLHKNLIQNPDEKREHFLKAFESINVLKDKLSWDIMFFISIVILYLTFIATITTVIAFVK